MIGDREHVTKHVCVYDTKSATWSWRDNMKSERAEFCAAFVDGALYAIGGQYIETKKGSKISE